MTQSRRELLQGLATLPLTGLAIGACGSATQEPGAPAPATSASNAAPGPSAVVPSPTDGGTLTPTCGEVTASAIEGPYFKASSPERASLLDGSTAEKMILRGVVRSTACAPIAGALVELWQADEAGAYDNVGFHLRGHQFTDANGAYQFETVLPGLYPGRTRHLHVKVQPKGGPVLTTQLYFPGETGNAADSFFAASLVMEISRPNGFSEAKFDFVV